mgnify:FL=1
MIIKYSPTFFRTLKKADARIRKGFKEKILIFSKNPNDPELDNHLLKEPYQGLRSIDITADWRVIYEDKSDGEEAVAYFIILGTHKELYK